MFQDIISDSWVYQEIFEKGWRKGLELGLKQRLLLTYIETCYPQLVVLAQQQITPITDPIILNQTLSTLFALQSIEEVEQYLTSLGNSATKN